MTKFILAGSAKTQTKCSANLIVRRSPTHLNSDQKENKNLTCRKQEGREIEVNKTCTLTGVGVFFYVYI